MSLSAGLAALTSEVEGFVVAGPSDVVATRIEREPARSHVSAAGCSQQPLFHGHGVGALLQHPVAVADEGGRGLP